MKKKVPKRLLYSCVKVMRLTMLICCVFCSAVFTLSATPTSAQNILENKVSIQLNNLTIKQALDKISKASGVKFVYSNDVLNSRVKINTSIKNKELGQLLDAVLKSNAFVYEVIDNDIIIHYDRSLPSSKTTAKNPSWVLNGSVLDEKGEPLVGATVRINGTSRASITDINGKFMIEVESESDSVSVFYVGYLTKTLRIGSAKNLTIQMQPDLESQKLNEVVVVGYGTQKKISVTGAISEVPVKNLQRIATPSLSNALAGSMPGIITRQSSGEPGYDGAAVFIRGFGTWANRDPLVLIDGVAGRDMNNINTQEIESFTILKDASATAVYGVQGANGVILITTKRGALGKPRIIFRTETAALTALRLPEYISGPEYAGLVNEARTNENLSPLFQQEELDKYADGSDPYLYPNVDWVNTILKKNTIQTINNLSVTGGSETFKYYTNVGYTILDGIYKQDPDNYWNNNAKVKRYNFRSNVDVKLSKTVDINLGLGGIIQKGNYPGRSAPDIFNSLKVTSPINFPVLNPDGSIAGGQTSYLQENPYGLVSRSGYSTQDRNTLQATFGTKWDLSSLVTKGLSLRGLFAYDYYSFAWNDRRKPYAIRQYLGKDADGDDIYRNPDIREEAPMDYGAGSSSERIYYAEAALNYSRSFDKHAVTGLLLANQRDAVELTAGSSLYNLPYRRNGVAARITYEFDSRYLLEGNMGYNGSENFPQGKQYGFFPSVSAGWVISNESFWKLNAVNSLKIRGSYGKVGNDKIGGRRFLYLSTMVRGGQSMYFGDTQAFYEGINEDQLGNPDVTWEVGTKSNIGLDVELFDGKIAIQADAFREYREGILIQRGVVPRVAGYYPWSIPYANLGEAKNHGIDAMLEIRNTTPKGFFYNIRGNITYAKSLRVKDDLPTYLYPYQNPIGHLIDQPFGLVSLGLFQSQEEIDNSPRQTFIEDVRPGDIKYMDVNGDGKIDVFDQVAIGYARTPQLVYGANFIAAYKGFEASVFFTGAARTSLFIDGPSMYPFQMGLATYNVMREYYDNRWTPDNRGAAFPRVSTMDNRNNNRTSTHFLRDASYIRLKSAEIAYNFQMKPLLKYGLKDIRLFVNGMNLVTWDKIKVIDPESNYGTGGYPLQRSFNFGGQFTF